MKRLMSLLACLACLATLVGCDRFGGSTTPTAAAGEQEISATTVATTAANTLTEAERVFWEKLLADMLMDGRRETGILIFHTMRLIHIHALSPFINGEDLYAYGYPEETVRQYMREIFDAALTPPYPNSGELCFRDDIFWMGGFGWEFFWEVSITQADALGEERFALTISGTLYDDDEDTLDRTATFTATVRRMPGTGLGWRIEEITELGV